MTTLSGLVAILDVNGQPTGEVRDLGPKPIQVRPGRVVPVDDVKPELRAGEEYGSPTLVIVDGRAVRTYPAIVPPPDPPSLESRVAALEAKIAEMASAELARG